MSITNVNGIQSFIDDAAHQTRTVSLAITSGNLIVVSCGFGQGGAGAAIPCGIVKCTDNLTTPTVYQLAAYTYDNSDGGQVISFWGIATSTGTATITVDAGTGNTPGLWRMSAQQYNSTSGWPAQPLDGIKGTVQATLTGTNAIVFGPRTTQNNGDLVYAVMWDEFTDTVSFTAGTSPITFTSRGQVGGSSGAGNFFVEDGIQITAGPCSATATGSTTSQGVYGHMICFSASTGSFGLSLQPSVFVDFETSTNGTTLTSTIAKAGTHGESSTSGLGGGGTWGSWTSTTMTVATSAEQHLISPFTVNGNVFTDTTATRGISYNTPTTQEEHAFGVDHCSLMMSIGYWVKFTFPLTEDHGTNQITNQSGTDFCSLLCRAGLAFLETLTNPSGNPDTGTKFTYALNTWYWIALVFDAQIGASHKLTIYDASGNVLSVQTKVNAGVASSVPFNVNLGVGGDTSGVAGTVLIDDLVIDGETNMFVAPGFIPPPVIVNQGFGACADSEYIWLGGDDN